MWSIMVHSFYLVLSGTLFARCDAIQQIDVQLVNKLYGIPPEGDFCLIANPEQCWQEIRRRSYLSLTPSDAPELYMFTHPSNYLSKAPSSHRGLLPWNPDSRR